MSPDRETGSASREQEREQIASLLRREALERNIGSEREPRPADAVDIAAAQHARFAADLRAHGEAPAALCCVFPDMHTTCGTQTRSRGMSTEIVLRSTAHVSAEASYTTARTRLHHLRAEQGRHEIDIVAEVGARDVLGIEVKAASAPSIDDAKHLIWLRDELGPRFLRGVVLHTGPRTFELSERIVAAPISSLWGPG